MKVHAKCFIYLFIYLFSPYMDLTASYMSDGCDIVCFFRFSIIIKHKYLDQIFRLHMSTFMMFNDVMNPLCVFMSNLIV